MKNKFPGFKKCMEMMRDRNPGISEDGFHWLLAEASDHVHELIEAFQTEEEFGLRCWLVELFPVDWDALLRGTELRFEYRLHLLAQTRHDYPDEVSEEAADLKAEFGDDPDKVRVIDDVASSGEVPRFTESEQER